MAKTLKKVKDTSRGGRRLVTLNNPKIQDCCEWVSRQSGYPYQKCFDELMSMFVDGYLFGVGTRGVLFARITEKMAK